MPPISAFFWCSLHANHKVKMNRFIASATIAPKPHLYESFLPLAHEFFENWIIVSDGREYEVMEAEFLFQTNSEVHNDPFLDGDDGQRKMAHWYLPVRGGVDLTFGCADFAAAIFLRTIRDLETGEDLGGPARIFQLLFQNAGFAFEGQSSVYIKRREVAIKRELFAIPRANLPVEEHSPELARRLKYAFRPYRFVRADIGEIIEKYLAAIYLEQVQGVAPNHIELQGKKYEKYLESFHMGAEATNIEKVWQRSQPLHRMTALMGYLSTHQPEDLR